MDFESANIAADIFELTLGHKGLVGVCGYYIQCRLDFDESITSLDSWRQRTTIELRQFICGKATYESIMRALNKLSLEKRAILAAVLRYGTHTLDPVSLSLVDCTTGL